jgi:branched-chain amino acid transport system ATP-binding protein
LALLECRDIHTYYSQIHALKGISLSVDTGEVVTLIGANGAGKSTTLKTVSGLLAPREGDIVLEGTPVGGKKAHELVQLGIVHVPEGRGIFGRLSVEENLRVGAYTRRDRVAIASDLERVYGIFPRLRERRTQRGGTLSGGEQQMLAIGRGLMADPRILLLDEPSMGLAPLLVEEIFSVVRDLNQRENVTILLVEQNALAALDVAHRGYVIETGRIRLSGTSAELRTNPEVMEAYLGIG